MTDSALANMTESDIYFIAEIGVNHEGSIEKAKEMVWQAAKAGANAAKFQVYKAENLVIKEAKSYWDTSEESETSQLALFQKYDAFGPEEYNELFHYCNECGINFLATPFDVDCLSWLDPISKFYKVASADLTNFELLHALALLNKHIVMSVGASSADEIDVSLKFLFEHGCPSITILHCVLNYPCSIKNSYISHVKFLQERFENLHVKVGYSDHVPSAEAGDDQLIAALSYGCRVFERHFTFDKNLPGNDHYHALDQKGLKSVISRLNAILPCLQTHTENELLNSQRNAIREARRSVVLKHDKKAGNIIAQNDITCKRPATGLLASEFFKTIGRTLKNNVKADTPLQDDDFLK